MLSLEVVDEGLGALKAPSELNRDVHVPGGVNWLARALDAEWSMLKSTRGSVS